MPSTSAASPGIGSDAITITFTDSFIAAQPRVFYRLVVTRQ